MVFAFFFCVCTEYGKQQKIAGDVCVYASVCVVPYVFYVYIFVEME